MFESKVRDYFKGACPHFLVPAPEVPETVKLVFSIELLKIPSMSEVRSVHKVCFGASLILTGILSSKKSPNLGDFLLRLRKYAYRPPPPRHGNVNLFKQTEFFSSKV